MGLLDIFGFLKGKSGGGKSAGRFHKKEQLAEVARNHPDKNLRMTAVKNLKDKSLLKDLALQAKFPEVRAAALEKLNDPELMVQVLKSDKSPQPRAVAAERINDPALMADLAKNDNNAAVRLTAAKKITDPAILGDLASYDDSSEVRLTAVQKLEDQSILADVAMYDGSEDVRKAAVAALNDQNLLARLVYDTNYKEIRKAAVDKITDENILNEVAEKTQYENIRWAIHGRMGTVKFDELRRLEDEETLREIAMDDDNLEFRLTATRFITKPKILRSLVKNSKDPKVREAAAQQLRGETNLSAKMRLLPVPNRPYLMGVFPVTNAQFRLFKPDHDSTKTLEGCRVPKSWMDPEKANADENPVVCVSRQEAVKFCEWMSYRENRPYRLPTYDEWEYSTLAMQPDWWIADENAETFEKKFRDDLLWFDAYGTRGFKEAMPNPWGFYDTLGNVSERVLDLPPSANSIRAILRKEKGRGGEEKDPLPPHIKSPDFQVLAGSGWGQRDSFEKNWKRLVYGGTDHDLYEDQVGFRVICEVNRPAEREDGRPPSESILRYRLILQNEIALGYSLDEVKENLANSLVMQEETIDNMFAVRPYVIQEHRDYYALRNYKGAYDKAGAITTIEIVKEEENKSR